MPLEIRQVGSLIDFLTALLDDGTNLLWFRGQGCSRRSLLPSLLRCLPEVDAAYLLGVEQRLITRFRQRSLPYWPEGYPQEDWEHLFAMQHYGLPTRLLDWSQNALVAAYFASQHDVSRCECESGACRPTVWALDPVSLNRNNSRLEGYGDAIKVLATSDSAIEPWAPSVDSIPFAPWPIALYGTHNSPRIVAQQGTFTVSGKELIPLEQCPAVTSHVGVLTKFVLLCSHAEIADGLRRLGTSQAAVFPDLSGVSADIMVEELG